VAVTNDQAGRSRGFDARVAHPARVYDYWLLRHEACYRAGVRDLRRRTVGSMQIALFGALCERSATECSR
jgi:hypothetical protein